MTNFKSADSTRGRIVAFRISPKEEESLIFLTKILSATPSEVVRRALRSYSYGLASSISPGVVAEKEPNDNSSVRVEPNQ